MKFPLDSETPTVSETMMELVPTLMIFNSDPWAIPVSPSVTAVEATDEVM